MRRGRLWLALALLVFTGASQAHEVKAPATIEHYPLEKLNDRIYVVHGGHDLPNPENRGFMNNPGAILTANGVIVVDPGSSAEIGRQFLDKIRAVSDKPVIAVFNTHVHGDHWLGNQGIRERYPDVPIYAHRRAIARINAGEGQQWVDLFMDMTQGAVAGTRVVAPGTGLAGGEELRLDGVTIRVHHTGPAHSDTDIMLEVVDENSLFCGDIVAANTVPNSVVPQDASFKGTIAAIEAMLARDIELFIPGHGRSGGPDVPAASLRFLQTMYASVTRYYNQGLQDYEMRDRVADDLSAFKDWNQFGDLGRVISYVYQEVEKDAF